MPSESRRQHDYFEMIDHSPEAARRTGVSQAVAHDFASADKKDKSWKRKERVTAQKAGCSQEIYDLLMKV